MKAERAARARVALDAYQGTGGVSTDEREALADLVVDLLHLADTFPPAEHPAHGWRAAALTERALMHHAAEGVEP